MATGRKLLSFVKIVVSGFWEIIRFANYVLSVVHLLNIYSDY